MLEVKKRQRVDIQIWRCIAVLAVVIFHIKPQLLPGGYLGVDVFFAVSGYLMTKHIMDQVELGTWSMQKFFKRRVKRLFPALYTVIALTLVAAIVFFPPDRVETTAKSSIAAIFAVSNFFFWRTTDYFDTSSSIDPLLHTWSLGVEEQFYLIWPLILFGFSRIFKSEKALFVLILCLFGISIISSEYFVRINSSTAFYLLPFRIFEFAIGGFFALLVRKYGTNSRWAKTTFLISILITSMCFFVLNDSSKIPGVIALFVLLPVSITFACDLKLKPLTLVFLKPFKLIGDFSYSLYLVHWPIIIFWPLLFPKFSPNEIILIVVKLVVCLISGFLLYRYVETPLREQKSNSFSSKAMSTVIILFIFNMVISTYMVNRAGHFVSPSEYTLELRNAINKNGNQYALNRCFFEDKIVSIERYKENGCLKTSPKKLNVLLFGDSIAAQYSLALNELAKSKNWEISQITKSACSPILEKSPNKDCEEHNLRAISFVQNSRGFDLIIVAGNFYNSRNTRIFLGRTLELLEKSEAKIMLLGPHVRDDIVPRLLGQYSDIPTKVDERIYDHLADNMFAHADEFHSEIQSLQPTYFKLENTLSISMSDIFCEDVKECKLLVSGKSLYRDQIHLSPVGAEWVVNQLPIE